MSKCKVKGCKNFTRYKNTKQIYCVTHLARVRRHGYPEFKKDAYQTLEKLPHSFVDSFIIKKCKTMIDVQIAQMLKEKGYKGANANTVKYRRRKLGIKKYLYGEIQKHKVWVRLQALKKYGEKCELCGYNLSVDTHHIKPKNKGGLHETDNLMVLCPNCHALITRKIFSFTNRQDIPGIRNKIKKILKAIYHL